MSRELRTSDEGMRARPAQAISERRERGFEVFRGTGYGHPISGVNSKAVSVYANTRQGLSYYCDREPLQANVEFEIVEVMPFDDGACVEYVIRRTATSWAYVVRDERGETVPSTNLCAACHERGGPDPFFRAPQTCPTNRNRR
jgi:hypothetical protein